ncbi:MAG: hypothetical protein D6782_07940, partial [Alphaproteobacteria bacterium]
MASLAVYPAMWRIAGNATMVLLPSQGGDASFFQPITIGPGLLGGFFAARLGLASGPLSRAQIAAAAQDPAVIPPWRIDQGEKTLARRLAQVRNLDSFIDLDSDIVKRAGNDVDTRATFALFEALSALQTLAQAAAEKATPDSRLTSLDAKFQQGLGEIRQFLSAAALDKLSLLFGDKKNRVGTALALGKDTTSYTGAVVQTGDRNAAIAGLTGTESLTVSISKSGVSENIAVDLSAIAGPLTIDAVVDHINQQIAAIVLIDGSGNPVLDGNGNPVSKYLSRFKVTGNSTDGFRIALEGTLTETVKLSQATPAPALYVTAGLNSVTDGGPTIGRLVKIDDLASADPAIALRQTIAASDADQQGLNASIDADKADSPVPVETRATAVATDAEGFVYVVGTTPGDLGSQRGDGADDVFLTKYDSNGEVVFSRLLGTNGTAEGLAITTDTSGNVVIAGQVDGKIAGTDALSGRDSFVVKFDSAGNEIFRFQLDNVASDSALGLATAANGDVIVVGEVAGTARAGLTAGGGDDGYVLRLDAGTGAVVDAAQFGGAGSEQARAVTVAGDGSVLVAAVEDGRAVVRKLDGVNLANQLDRIDLGALGGGNVAAIAVADTGGTERVVVAGTTFAGGIGGTQLNGLAGSSDGFVATLTNGAGG